MVEGLSGDVRSAEERNIFSRFRVGNVGLSMTHILYANDVCSYLGEALVRNI